MTAADHLSDQFSVPKGVSVQPISRIMAMTSAEGDTDRPTVGHLMDMKRDDIRADTTGHYDDIRADMQANGQTSPLKVSKAGAFKDGHHRVAIAVDLGWSHMQVRR